MIEMDSFLKEFGQALKARRKEMGLSQVTAAQNMKIDYRHYQNIEGGKINLRLDTMIKLIQFYKLSNSGTPFNLNAFLGLLSGSQASAQHSQNWRALYKHFVDGGHAGYLVVRCDNKAVVEINDRLFNSLGFSSKAAVIGQALKDLVNEEGFQRMKAFCESRHPEAVSAPMVVLFKAQPQGFPRPMMALIRVSQEPSGGVDQLHCMFFDRTTLDEEGHRLTDIVSGYKQFMELYPQLKAV